MAAIKIGVCFFTGVEEDPAKVEALGYDSLWTSEHVFFHGPTSDALTTLAAFSVGTSRIKLGTAVLLLPLRPAAVTAKAAASVDILSGGRVILGVGVGGEYPREFQACGVPVNERGARTNEAMRLLRRLWSEDNVTFDGRFNQVEDVTLLPKPIQPGGPPIWVAGRSEAAMRRAGRLADGYLPYLFAPERYSDALDKVREHARQAGRDPEAIEPALYQFICLADTYEEAKRIAAADLQQRYNQPFEQIVDRYVVMGPPADCVRRLEQYTEAGVRHFVLVPIVPSGQFMAHIEAYARDIVPRLR
jgi:probable F420-dependent oxidoreductase